MAGKGVPGEGEHGLVESHHDTLARRKDAELVQVLAEKGLQGGNSAVSIKMVAEWRTSNLSCDHISSSISLPSSWLLLVSS